MTLKLKVQDMIVTRFGDSFVEAPCSELAYLSRYFYGSDFGKTLQPMESRMYMNIWAMTWALDYQSCWCAIKHCCDMTEIKLKAVLNVSHSQSIHPSIHPSLICRCEQDLVCTSLNFVIYSRWLFRFFTSHRIKKYISHWNLYEKTRQIINN